MSLHHMNVLCTQSTQRTRCGREVKSLGTSCMATQLEPSHARQLHVAGAPLKRLGRRQDTMTLYFTEILRRFQKFHNALITIWERYLE